MTTISRRAFVAMSAAGIAAARGASAAGAESPGSRLSSLTTTAQPISAQEHEARLAKVQALMQQRNTGALLVEAGSTMEYFTGVRWWRSERTTAAVIPASGRVIIITPFFESPSVEETLQVGGDVRTWQEDESPFELIAGALREHASAKSPLAVEDTTRFFIVDRVTKALGSARLVISGEDLVRACRMFKSRAELALMQAANDVTLAALRYLHGRVDAGMQGPDILKELAARSERPSWTHHFSILRV